MLKFVGELPKHSGRYPGKNNERLEELRARPGEWAEIFVVAATVSNGACVSQLRKAAAKSGLVVEVTSRKETRDGADFRVYYARVTQ